MANEVVNHKPTDLMLRRRQERGSRNRILEEGVSESFPVVSLRGKQWRVKYQGVETNLEDARGRPLRELDCVILDAGPISKQWFEKNYATGDSGVAPDCWSMDGVKPDPQVPKRQSPTCAPCQWNIWGSAGKRSGGEGRKGKACSDGRRVALMLPPGTIKGKEDEIVPAMLRFPPTSLAPLKAYAQLLDRQGFDYDMVVTRMSFADTDQPVVEFEKIMVLSDTEYQQVSDLASTDDTIGRMLRMPVTAVTAEPDDPGTTVEPEVEQPKGYTSFTRRGATTPAAEQPTPSAAPAAAPAGWPPANAMQLKNGKWIDTETGDFLEPPAPEEAPARNVKRLKNGQLVDLDTGEFIEEDEEVSGQKPEPEIIAPGEKPKATFFGNRTAPEEAKEVNPTSAKAKRSNRKGKAEVVEAEAAPETAANGSGEVVPASQGLLDVLSGMFPKGN